MCLMTETTPASSLQLSSPWEPWSSSLLSSGAVAPFASHVRMKIDFSIQDFHSYIPTECLLNLYSLCLLAIVVLQVLLAIFVFVYNKDIQQAAFRGWDRLWTGRVQSEINVQAVNQIQRAIECCGSSGPLDYGVNVPGSCCAPDAINCNELSSSFYRTGCKTQIKNVIEHSASWIAYLSIAMAIVEVRESFSAFKHSN